MRKFFRVLSKAADYLQGVMYKYSEKTPFRLIVIVGTISNLIYCFLELKANSLNYFAVGLGFATVLVSFGTLIIYRNISVFKKRKEVVSTLTMKFASQKNFEFAVSYALLLATLSMIIYLARYEILPLIGGIFACVVATQFLTIYRIQSGRFGYNASEMKELIYFVISKSGESKLPPGSKGLKPYPSSSILADDTSRGEVFGMRS